MYNAAVSLEGLKSSASHWTDSWLALIGHSFFPGQQVNGKATWHMTSSLN